MNIKKLLVGSLVVYVASITLCTAFVYKKGKNFESTLDKSPDSMDESITFGGKMKLLNGKVMRDLRVGAFSGGMQLDLTDVITDKKEYQMDIEVLYGGLNFIVPENFNVNLVDHSRFGGVSNNTICKDPENAVSLSVFADVNFGGINFENPVTAE
ncbi:LiaF domain-containing protein [Acetobacterium bakii]|uniref:Cell wall-active antibiotics response LiaF-like C-terminal domain-containing protein n=1 Tax=Acetobacterium bakii TaxID=52689 RepID=A0A0L6U358_9FIRM|nr:LiaF domain-containing protein [Acetobacterium bakii]KNZ42938.1 hypothetical protein AKG39_04255 [Acetobacterium bakii]